MAKLFCAKFPYSEELVTRLLLARSCPKEILITGGFINLYDNANVLITGQVDK
jgi:hypothetical protein